MNKYFIPDITELKIGYQCERYSGQGSHLKTIPYNENFWKPYTIEKYDLYSHSEGGSIIEDIISDLEKNRLRVCYLTKENIESEGWEIRHCLPESRFKVFNKGKYELRGWEDEYLEIHEAILKPVFSFRQSDGKPEYSCIFEGYCKSINELRDAQKLLKIK